MRAEKKSPAVTILLLGAVLIAIVLVAGIGYEQVERARDTERIPQIGRSVDIGGRSLNLYCSGAGKPAVIFQSGSPWPLYQPREMFENGTPRPGYSWVLIQRETAKLAQACWYDRAGAGWSDLGPYPRTSAAAARDLHALLQAAAIPPPYVLAAEESAALDAHVYTGFYPAEVAGLVLVDAVHPDLLTSAPQGRRRIRRIPTFVLYSQDVSSKVFNLVGFWRFASAHRRSPGPPPQGLTPREWTTIWSLTQAPKARTALMQDVASWDQSTREARAAGTLGSRPLRVISSANPITPSGDPQTVLELQADLARLSTQGKQLVIPESSTLVYQAPDVVIHAVREVVDRIRR